MSAAQRRQIARGSRTTRFAICCALVTIVAAPTVAQTGRPDVTSSVSVRSAQKNCFNDKIELPGHLMPRKTIDVVPDREGFKVAQIMVEPLDSVLSGQALAQLVPLSGANLPAMTISAPVSGILLRSNVSIGQPVSPKQSPMFQISARGEIDFVAQAPLAIINFVKIDNSTIIRLLDGRSLNGRVRQIEPGADPANQDNQIKVTVETPRDIRVGTFARAVVTVEQRCGLGVPFSAIQYEADGTVVRVVNGDRVETRQVTVGLLNGAEAEIRSGLSETDLVVVRAGSFLREGDRVEPVLLR
ncbi:efflux RND transporter periplasmic adaptor subunit [Methylobacterium sp. WL7]|uniref:efflux RND transporter periplasmic adaptor subunit n=1 Tax=Methylobacterium sp. WL7 TaxID=2603900 RepID=UPI0011CA6201|nr:efflux RND transporter periplasmic adaptor subunit [Methylobacterium sp. WL7]TXN43210.1 efflux RND transporter periplasmic adaptor subunit [Methylobacterium sp. WL7]